jgi:ABC-type nitrate/sulfonate/bicarbonate transport system permease component
MLLQLGRLTVMILRSSGTPWPSRGGGRAGGWAYELLTPLSTIMRWLPPPVLALLCTVWFGYGSMGHIIFVAIVSFIAVLQDTAIPYTKGKFPWIGLRAGLLAALTWGIIIEMLGSHNKGLGFLIMNELQNASLSALLQAGLLFVALSLLADLTFRSIYAFTRPKLVAK